VLDLIWPDLIDRPSLVGINQGIDRAYEHGLIYGFQFELNRMVNGDGRVNLHRIRTERETGLFYDQLVDSVGHPTQVQIALIVSSQDILIPVCLAFDLNGSLHASALWVNHSKVQFATVALTQDCRSTKEE
jgi:hypothetical protein